MKILIPTDFSRNAFKAFEYGAEVFAWTNPELILVNIQNARHAGSMMSLDLNQELMAAANKDMEDELKVCKKAYPNLQIRGIVTAGTFTDSVLEISEENNIDIIIAGTKGATGAKEVFLGSNASALVDYAIQPLIVVPEEWTPAPIKKIMLATDFINQISSSSYDVVLDLCYQYKAPLDIFHVKKLSDKSYTEDEIPFTVEGLTYELNEVESEAVEDTILRHGHEFDIDLISLVKSKGNFIYNLFHKSLSKKLSMHTDTPLLILR